MSEMKCSDCGFSPMDELKNFLRCQMCGNCELYNLGSSEPLKPMFPIPSHQWISVKERLPDAYHEDLLVQ